MAIISNRKKGRRRIRGRELTSKQLARWGALATLGVALGCGIVGIVTTTVWFEAAVLLALSTGLAYIVVATHESAETIADITKAIDKASGKLTAIPVPDHIFRHASHALEARLGKGGWQRICLYAPVGVWMESKDKDQWLNNVIAALRSGEVQQCWGVYGLPPKSEAAAWHAHGARRLRRFIDAEHTQLHYLPAEDGRHPGAQHQRLKPCQFA